MSGIGKGLIKSYDAAYLVKSAQDAFPESKEEVERKAPLLIQATYGFSAMVIPLTCSGIYKVAGFRASLDILGVLFSFYAASFTIHAVRSHWRRKSRESLRQ